MLTEEIIKTIASEESNHVCESGAPNAKQHNARVVEQAIWRAIAEITPDEITELRERIVSLQFQLKTSQSQNDEHEQDYMAVWKLIKQPNETVVEAAKRVVKELAAAQKEIESIADLFHIGSEARKDRGVLLTNIRNTIRRADCLSAIEREFFTITSIDESGEDHEEYALSWGDAPEQYVEKYRTAIAKGQS